MRYRRGWGLRDCTFQLPTGRISALIGPNGAGKSTLMRIATGLLRPTGGSIEVLGEAPGKRGTNRKLAFLAQDKPLYKGFTVEEMLKAGAKLNPDWDSGYARRLVREADVPFDAKVGTLSGGQRTRIALAIALGRRPELVMLDEPLADLDPIARQEVMQSLLAEVAETGMTVLLSSHVIADLDGVCDHLLLLADGRVQLHGDVDDLLTQHRILIGSRELVLPDGVVEARTTGRQATVLARTTDVPGWDNTEPSLEELALAYLRSTKKVAA
ncbi:ABC transporter ATP-binding protein [Lentzea tibetensis]|uniref:ABC transporter ATP-binding protein n=1 Tax=Lentzea tibetensis TaxID=2591470 RepID=A0A563F2C1_9PSEU|nr:ABC transporter ATP-binding protein [Lentzea tibetensis]